MSSCDCTNLEGYVYDCLYGHYTILHIMLITREIERRDSTMRERVLNWILEFDEENQSWRDYRNSLHDYVFEPSNDQIDAILTITKPVQLAAMLLFEHHVSEVCAACNDQDAERFVQWLVPYCDYPKIENFEYVEFMPLLKKWWQNNLMYRTPLLQIEYKD